MKFKMYSLFKNHLINYPTPLNINMNWCYGSAAGCFLMIQMITGLLLAAQFVSESSISFENVEYIMREVNYGWFLSYLHANGASFFFMLMYFHLLKAMFYKSYCYPSQFVWFSGVIILFLSILTAFMGYVLPWGQMSFWAATVMTNLVTAVPFLGNKLVIWMWGDFSVSGSTLKKFFMLHFLMPFILLALVIIHLTFLHESKSNDPLIGVMGVSNFMKFYPYFFLKDLLFLIQISWFYLYFVFYFPNLLGHPDNYIEANPLVTPSHIVPEWYFSVSHAILSSVPDKMFGVISMIFSILGLLILPLLDNSKIKMAYFNNLWKYFFTFFLFSALGLSWIGSAPAEEPFIFVGRLFTFFYFFFFFLVFLQAVIFKYLVSPVKEDLSVEMYEEEDCN